MVTRPKDYPTTPLAPWEERLIAQVVYHLITDQIYRSRAIELLIERAGEIAREDPQYWEDLRTWIESLSPIPPEEKAELDAIFERVLRSSLNKAKEETNE